MTRRLIASLIVFGLGAGIWLLWPRADSPAPATTTQPIAGASTTTLSEVKTSTTRASPSTSTTSAESHVVETVEEAEAILRDLWFGWFEGIYNQDEDRIREVVGTSEAIDAARSQFGQMLFSAQPASDLIELSDTELLRSDESCVAVWSHLDVGQFRQDTSGSEGVYVLRFSPPSWYLLSVWTHREDLWDRDCDSLFSPPA